MSEEYIEFSENDDKIFEEAIKKDGGVCRYLYHGTSKKIAHEIKKLKGINTEYGEIGYLGKGFYCFHWDTQASRIWAKGRYKEESVAVLVLETDLGNTFFVNEELREKLSKQVSRSQNKNNDLSHNQKIGILIESGIENIIIPDYGIDIHTVGRAYLYKYKVQYGDREKEKRRPALMYCLRYSQMINDVEICWEEQ